MTPGHGKESVLAARDRYLRESGLSTTEYTATRFSVRIGSWRLHLPNPVQRQASVAQHDLHHVATGFRTDWQGEMEISAWEVGAGLGGLWVAWLLCVPFFLGGLIAVPQRTIRAYRVGRHCRSLFADPTPYETLLSLTVGELRKHIGLPPEGLDPAG